MKKLIVLFTILFAMSAFSMALTLPGATPDEKAQSAVNMIEYANTGQEIDDVIAEASKDPQVKAALMLKLSSKIKGSAAAAVTPTGKTNIIFIASSGSRVDTFFVFAQDKSITDMGSTAVPDWAYQVNVDETLLPQLRGTNSVQVFTAAMNNGRIRIQAKPLGAKLNVIGVRFVTKIASIFSPVPSPPVRQEKCPLFCSYSMMVGDASGGVGIPDCEVTDFTSCKGRAYTGTRYEACGCTAEAPAASPCPDTCKLDGSRSCWVDRRLVGKTGEVCAGHVFGVGGFVAYQKAPGQPACICR
jgi:hypothetical protein